MRSPHQAPQKSTPLKANMAGGVKNQTPQASSRATPTTKTPAKIYQQHFKSATG